MKTLVLGASGATGKLVVAELLQKGVQVRVVVRHTAIIPDALSSNPNVEIIKGNIHEFTQDEIKQCMLDCDCIVCCLGHNISFKGLFGKPRNLVDNAVQKVVQAIESGTTPKKFILMSTTAYTNKKHGEVNPFGEKLIFAVLELLLPPHKDNICAGDYLVYEKASSKMCEWVAVRPDSLIDKENISEYTICPSKTRSPIFNPGKASRINVAHFMVELLVKDDLWRKWKYQTPVLYNE